VGDSTAVFCESREDPGSGFNKLTVDHRISDPGEKRRLADLGIELGKNRTRLYGLNLSRCLGDHFIKSADLGFTAVPSVSPVLKLGPRQSGLLVIASDGLWDVAEPGRVMEVTASYELQLQVNITQLPSVRPSKGCNPSPPRDRKFASGGDSI
jgi:serine/threonine protein phosphatase PrpC